MKGILRACMVIVACLAFAPMAQAAHRHHYYHHYRYEYYYHHHRHHVASHHYVARHFHRRLIIPVTESNILRDAERYIGDHNPTGHVGPWCRDFVNMVLRQTGHYVDRSRRAIDSLRLGIRVRFPRPGDLVVMRNHVTFFAGWIGDKIVGLGGNQGSYSNSKSVVRFSAYPRSRVIAFIRVS